MSVDLEVWKPIPGWGGLYEVSNKGNVYSVRYGYALYATVIGRGYLGVSLYKNGEEIKVSIHKLVMLAFVGPCPDGYEINHKDGNKTNNNRENLEYVTSSENNRHAFALGLQPSTKGEKNPFAYLTNEEVIEIRKLYETGQYSQRKLAKQFNVSQTTISQIINRIVWAHLE